MTFSPGQLSRARKAIATPKKETTVSTTTPAPKPDLPTQIDQGVTELAGFAGPFLPPKVRTAIYVAGGAVAVTCETLSPIIGGTVGTVIAVIGGAAAALASATAVAHISA